MKKPNLLVIMTDQQSWDMMSCAGNPYLKTPNMDFLAKKGVRFTRAQCANPVCIPSRLSLMTGVFPSVVGITNNSSDLGAKGAIPKRIFEEGMGKRLTEAGYTAVYGGKQHLPYMNAEQLGFTYIEKDERSKLAQTTADYWRNYKDDKPIAMIASFINPHDICMMAISSFADQTGDEMDKRLIRVCAMETEIAWEAAKLPEGMHSDVFYETTCPRLPANHVPAEDEAEAITWLQAHRNFKRLARERWTERDWRLHRWAYARLTEKVDAEIGILLAAVIDSGKWDDTVIVFTSDHGDMDSAHKMEHKTALFQECCQVPFIIKGISGNRIVGEKHTPVNNGIDLLPTLYDYAGIPIPDYVQGVSLKETVEDPMKILSRETVCVESEIGLMTTDGRHKYIRHHTGARAEQFYDLETNPGENRNQISDPAYGEPLARLRKALEARLESVETAKQRLNS